MTKEIETKQPEIKFLSDAPLKADRQQDIRFGHLGIVENLGKAIINCCPCPFTIGLFGKWGSGKTTIINFLDKKLKLLKIPTVTFDVWKHENDALRRTFLIETATQLHEQKYKTKLNKRVNYAVSIASNILSAKAITTVVLIFLVAPILYCNSKNEALIGVLGGGGLVAAMVIWWLEYSTRTETWLKNRFEDPHEFEKEFENIVKVVRKKDDKKRIVIIIDNLDRASGKKAVELLSTVKTFLDKQGCIFLIACDDEAIKKYIKNAYFKDDSNSTANEDEFLRKFFNASLRIPPFIDTELQTYTEKLLEETNVSQFKRPDVVTIITKAFRENPRQIKQFINTLVSHFILAKGREGCDPPLIPKGTITGNVAFLAKILIIRQNFPSSYKIIVERNFTLEDMEDALSHNTAGVEEKEKNKVKVFLRATRPITVKNMSPFIYLKQSEEELSLPDELKIGLLDNNLDIVNKYARNIKDGLVGNFEKVIFNLIGKKQKYPIVVRDIISCAVEFCKQNNISLDDHTYDKFAGLLADEALLLPEIPQFKLSLVFDEILTRCSPENRRLIIQRYVAIFERRYGYDKPTAYEILDIFLSHKDLVTPFFKQIRSAIEELYASDINILSLFKDSIEYQKEFVSDKTIIKLIKTIINNDIGSKNNQKIELVNSFVNNASQLVANAFVQQCLGLTMVPPEDRPNLYIAIIRILLSDKIESKNSNKYFDNIYDKINKEDDGRVIDGLMIRLKELENTIKSIGNTHLEDKTRELNKQLTKRAKFIKDEKTSREKQMELWPAKKTAHLQGVDYLEIPLNGKSLKRLSFKVSSEDTYWRAGVQIEDPNARIKIPKIPTEKGFLFHATRTTNEYELTQYKDKVEKAQTKINVKDNQDVSLKIEIDSNNIIKCFINGILGKTYTLNPELFKKVYLVAWGDQYDYKVDFYDIKFTTD